MDGNPDASHHHQQHHGGSNATSSKKTDTLCLDFKLLVDDVKKGDQVTVHLVAPTKQEKEAWIADISQVNDLIGRKLITTHSGPFR